MFKFFATDRWYKEVAKAEEGVDVLAMNPNGLKPGEDPFEKLRPLLKPEPPVTDDSGSTYKVPYTTIVNITEHNNADSLEVAWVYGFQVIVKKGVYKVGDKVIYVPIDSILPQWLEDRLFPCTKDENGRLVPPKITLNKHRVRQIRIRKIASQGMIVNPQDVEGKVNPEYFELEQNLAAILGVEKYEPPQPGFAHTQGAGRNRNKKHENPLFHKYNGLDNIKWFPDLFKEEDEIVVQEKLHGTNARASVLPYSATTLWKRFKKWAGLAPEYENCYGSNNVEISAASAYKGFYGADVYGECFKQLDVFSKLKPGEIVYGEIVGPNIQKNYTYGLTERRFVVFDMKIMAADGKFDWQPPTVVEAWCKERGFEYVPVLYRGKFNKEMIYSLTKGPSKYGIQKVREGVVIKAVNDYCVGGNKKALKWVSEDYLNDSDNTDFH